MAVLGGAALAWWARAGEPARAALEVKFEEAPRESILEGLASSSSERVDADTGPTPAAPSPPDAWAILVLDDDVEEFIAGAQVRLVRYPAGFHSQAVFRGPLLQGASAVSDESGRATLSWPSNGELPTHVAMRHAEYGPSAWPLLKRTSVQVLRASRGERIGGTVVDQAGNPMAGVEVSARAVELPATVEGTGVCSWGRRSWNSAKSDSSGLFSMWVKPGRYFIGAQRGGWTTVKWWRLSSQEDRRINFYTVRSGTEHARVVVQRVVGYSIVLIDGQSRKPIERLPSVLNTFSDESVEKSSGPMAETFVIGGKSLRVGVPVAGIAGSFQGAVRVKPGSSTSPRVRLLVDVPGYAPATATVRLHPLTSLPGPGASDRLILRRLGAWEEASIVVSGEYVNPRLLDATPGSASAVFSGSRVGDEWVFRGVSAGHKVFRLDDGFRLSNAVSLATGAGKITRVRFEFEQLTGFVIDAVASDGYPIVDLDVLVYDVGFRQYIRCRAPMKLPATKDGTDEPMYVYPALPGPLRLIVSKTGFLPVRKEIELKPGEVYSFAKVVLTSE